MDNNTSLVNRAVERIFAERKDFIIIGLTGRTGCGCSTVAKLLQKSFVDLQPPLPHENKSIEDRGYKIIYEYAKNTWIPFRLIEMKHIIFTFILEHDYEEMFQYVKKYSESAIDFSNYEKTYNDLHQKRVELKQKVENGANHSENILADDDLYSFYFNEIPKAFDEFQKLVPVETYTILLQKIGDNIRASGDAFSEDVVPENVLKLSQRVNMLIKILRQRNIQEKKQVLIVIDAFRNPYEATFFKDRYSAFYLFAINSLDNERKNRLIKKGFTYDDVVKLDKKEYPSLSNEIGAFYNINIEKTVEKADIHINNPDSKSKTYDETKRQLIRYISLIMHPGLIPPTQVEYCMQSAYNARLNSGCLSRQVGAVISDSKYSIIASGWNTTPAGQVPCSLRSLFSLIHDDEEDEIGMSEYERMDEKYRNFVREKTENIDFSLLKGRNCSYCFKDAYISYKKQKNQVHTRAIHAEEMAFLQAAKIGTPIVTCGYLFTTASPCELCSKKAYHLGISKIYYIDKYPGISYEHILNCGESSIDMIPFSGAIGRAYTQLYTEILPYKDELYMLLGLKF